MLSAITIWHLTYVLTSFVGLAFQNQYLLNKNDLQIVDESFDPRRSHNPQFPVTLELRCFSVIKGVPSSEPFLTTVKTTRLSTTQTPGCSCWNDPPGQSSWPLFGWCPLFAFRNFKYQHPDAVLWISACVCARSSLGKQVCRFIWLPKARSNKTHILLHRRAREERVQCCWIFHVKGKFK